MANDSTPAEAGGLRERVLQEFERVVDATEYALGGELYEEATDRILAAAHPTPPEGLRERIRGIVLDAINDRHAPQEPDEVEADIAAQDILALLAPSEARATSALKGRLEDACATDGGVVWMSRDEARTLLAASRLSEDGELVAPTEASEQLRYACGCVTCVCDSSDRCYGCGAKDCGNREACERRRVVVVNAPSEAGEAHAQTGQMTGRNEPRANMRTPEAGEPDAWMLVVWDEKNSTHALTNGRARLSIWKGEVEDPDLAALDAQLRRGTALLAGEPQPEAGEPDAWRNIITAPRDGTPVLIAGGVVEYDAASSSEPWPFDGVTIAHWDGDNWNVGYGSEYDGEYWHEPTHWMPVPKPPGAALLAGERGEEADGPLEALAKRLEYPCDHERQSCEEVGCEGPAMREAAAKLRSQHAELARLRREVEILRNRVGKHWNARTPTAENINALPEPIRRYIHDIEARCDPAGEVRELTIARDTTVRLSLETDQLRRQVDDLGAELATAEDRAGHAEETLADVRRERDALRRQLAKVEERARSCLEWLTHVSEWRHERAADQCERTLENILEVVTGLATPGRSEDDE